MKKRTKIRFNQIFNATVILAMISLFFLFFGWMQIETNKHNEYLEHQKGYREGLIDGLDSCQVKVDTFYCFPDTKFKKFKPLGK